jgi:HME family heavy-metal exporter
VLIPQIKIRVDYDAGGALRRGLRRRCCVRLEQMIEGERITQVVEGNRRFDLVVRLPEKPAASAAWATC